MNDQEEAMKRVFFQMKGSPMHNDDNLVLNYSDFLGAAINLQHYLNEEKLWSLFRYFD